jgi:chromosomal replication initiation ATPase DnaA
LFDLKNEPQSYEEIIGRAKWIRERLVGEGQKVVRWDLLRPEKPLAKSKEEVLKERHCKSRYEFRQVALESLPIEVLRLANCKSKWWRHKTIEGLTIDYANRHQIKTAPFVRKLARVVALQFNVPDYLIFGKTRVAQVVLARQEMCYLLRNRIQRHGKPMSYEEICRLMLLSDHTTSRWACVQVRRRRHAAR